MTYWCRAGSHTSVSVYIAGFSDGPEGLFFSRSSIMAALWGDTEVVGSFCLLTILSRQNDLFGLGGHCLGQREFSTAVVMAQSIRPESVIESRV